MSNKSVLIILPHESFRDNEYLLTKESLEKAGIRSLVASTTLTSVKGFDGVEITPDIVLDTVDPSRFDGFIFIGEQAAFIFEDNRDIMNILEYAFSNKKVVAAIGFSVGIVAKSQYVRSRNITGRSSKRRELETSGAFFTGSRVEQDHNLITAAGPFETKEFVDRIIETLVEVDEKMGRKYLR